MANYVGIASNCSQKCLAVNKQQFDDHDGKHKAFELNAFYDNTLTFFEKFDQEQWTKLKHTVKEYFKDIKEKIDKM